MKTIRNYGCKDSDLLFTAEMVAENLKAHLDVLSVVREQWTEEYANDFIARIHDAMSKYLSNDSHKTLRNATAKVNSIINKAIKCLSFFKTQVFIDFKDEETKKNEILETLGFKKYYNKVTARNQNALLQLLLAFKENLTDDIRSQLISKGFKQTEFDEIIDLAGNFKNANLHQENIKANKKQFFQEKRIALNAISNEVKGICRLASMKISDNPALKDIFTFKKVVSHVANIRKAKTENKVDVTYDGNNVDETKIENNNNIAQ